MRYGIARVQIVAGVLVAFLLCCSAIEGKGPKTTGGGGGGNDSAPPRFNVVEIPLRGYPLAMSETNANNDITVAISSAEAGSVSAAYARVNLATRTVVDSGYLPEPLFVGGRYGEVTNGASEAFEVNNFGEIVGYARAFDPTLPPEVDPSPSRAALWTPADQGYSLELLPSLDPAADTRAYGINNLGEVVGGSDNCEFDGMPRLTLLGT